MELKHLKKFEANIDAESNARKDWEKIEDESSWEFDYFFDKVCEVYNLPEIRTQYIHRDYECGIALSKNSIKYLNNIYQGDIDTRSLDPNNIDWSKRTSYFFVKIETGGSGGGSCWDDENNYARPYDTHNSTDPIKIVEYVESILYSIFGKNHPFANIKKIADEMSNIVHDDSYTEYEYYGNHVDYAILYIKVWDLYKLLVQNRAI